MKLTGQGHTKSLIFDLIFVLTIIYGWHPWSEWTPCSATCGGGIQQRSRICFRVKGCEGSTKEHRGCNSFGCEEARDLLSLVKMSASPTGVSHLVERPGAYRISLGSRMEFATRSLYPNLPSLPTDFAILATARPRSSLGALLGITSVHGDVKLTLLVGSKVVLVYSDQQGLPGRQNPIVMNVNLLDDQWHQVAVSVEGSKLFLYVDCELRSSTSLHRSALPRGIPLTGITAVGAIPKSRNHSNGYEGDIEQLVLIADPSAAKQQCGQLLPDVPLVSEYRLEASDFDASLEFNDGSGFPDEGSAAEFELEWSDWGPCSATCGRAFRVRTSHCVDNGRNLEECIAARRERSETQVCALQDCAQFAKSRTTSSPTDFRIKRKNATRPTVYAFKNCLNGGRVTGKGTCICRLGFQGDRCQQVSCQPPCANSGKCIYPGFCKCWSGYSPPACAPVCSPGCLNKGACIAPQTCRCPAGYTGRLCGTPVCKRGCRNNGRCVSPDKCSCSSGYHGDDCSTPICRPACSNGGTCLKPYFCLCPPGSSGAFCEKFTCTPKCKSGGKCIGLNKCSCPVGYTGKYCETATCVGGCQNGGTCIAVNKCACAKGFYGTRCDKRKCQFAPVKEPYKRNFKKRVNKVSEEPCGAWGWKKCNVSKSDYVTVSKTFYKTVYKCVED